MADEELRMLFASRLRKYLQANGFNQADLARHMHVSTATTAKWCTGQTMPRIDKVQSICNWLGIQKSDLLEKDLKPSHLADPLGHSFIPVYSAAGAGKPQPTLEDIISYVDYTGGPDGVIGVEIKGDSMAPTIPDNSLVIVNTNLTIESGDIVIVQINSDSEALCKRVQKYNDGLSLISDNPVYEPIYYTSKEVQKLPVRFIGKCTEVRKKL